MRQIVYCAAASLDGFIARLDGTSSWIPSDPDIDFAALFGRFDTILMGRKTYEECLKLGGLFPGMEAFVFSRTQVGGEFSSTPPVQLARELRNKPGKDLWLMGGGELAAEFLRADLLDAIQVSVCPILLGSGVPLFGSGGFPERRFRLANQRLYPKSGITMLDYERV